MTAAVLEPQVNPGDRLALTLALAVIAHAIIVLGVSFAPEPSPRSRFESMEIVLVGQTSEQAPEDAEVLAQANLVGGGNSDDDVRPSAPLEAPLPASEPEIAAAAPNPNEIPREVQEADQKEVQTKARAAPAASEVDQTTSAPLAKVVDNPQAPLAAGRDTAAEEEVGEQPTQRPQVSRKLPSAAELLTRSFALASLNAELQQRLENRAKRPRRKYISANTRESIYAAYMDAWIRKVERIGNLNYPDEARRSEISGRVLLDVALKEDGSVLDITVRRSSGHKVLDDAAVRIVGLASPFAPFPDKIAREVDELHITRTWNFTYDAKFERR
ncbi:MAG: TonB family protein [Pseudomonadota bacterium]